MNILLDQNISFRLVAHIASEFPNCLHVRDLGLTDYSDFQIFKFARANGFDVVFTYDEDFQNLLIEHGMPPKVVWFRTGNHSTRILAEIVIRQADVIRNFIADPSTECLEVLA